MRTTIRFALRFLAMVAVIAFLSIAFAPTGPATSPYGSSLSDLAVGTAMAAPRCHSGCGFKGGKVACVHVDANTLCISNGTSCAIKSC